MRFLVDAQLPPALARLLTARGHVADHVADIGLADATDAAIWHHAIENGAVIVTKDEDFAALLSASAANDPAVIWVRTGNLRRDRLLAAFAQILPDVEQRLAGGERLIELA